jgi:hypothetical protein
MHAPRWWVNTDTPLLDRLSTSCERLAPPLMPTALPRAFWGDWKGGAEARLVCKSVATKDPFRSRKDARERTMSYPGPGPIYRHCIMCGKPFRVWKCELLRNRAKFCTVQCYSASRRLFSIALADGRLERILAEERERVKRAAVC